MKRREKVLLIRWSIFATAVAAAFWAIWSLCGGAVPSSDVFLPWLHDGRHHLPFHASRWWDVPLAAPWVVAIWRLCTAAATVDEKHRDDFSGGVLLITALILLVASCMAAFGSDNDGGLFVIQAVFGLTGLLYGIAYREWRRLLFVSSLQSAGLLLALGLLTGPFHAFLWCSMAAAVSIASFGLGRTLRLARFPLAIVSRWLSAKGVADDPIPAPNALPKAVVVRDDRVAS